MSNPQKDAKSRQHIKQVITGVEILGPFDRIGEDKIKIVVENADDGNSIQVQAKLYDQTNWQDVDASIDGSDEAGVVFDLRLYDQYRLNVTDYEALDATGVSIFVSGFFFKSSASTGGAVDSVNGQTGDVVLTKSSIGLGNVNNTSDANKPVSTAQAAAILAAQTRSARTFAGFDPSGVLESVPGFSINQDSGGQFVSLTYEPRDSGTFNTSLQNQEFEINPVLATTDDSITVFNLNAHIDRTGSGSQLGNFAALFSTGLSLEGVGVVGDVVVHNQNVQAGTGSNAGMSGDVTANAFGWSVGADYTMDDFFGYSGGFSIDPLATVGGVNLINITSNGNNSGNYSALSFNHGGDIGGSYTGLYLNHLGDAASGIGIDLGISGTFAGSLSAISVNLQGIASAGYTGINFGSSLDFTGSSGTLANFNNQGDGDTFGGLSIGNSGDILTNLKMLNVSNTGSASDLEMLFLSNGGDADDIIMMNVFNTGNGDAIQLLSVNNSGTSTGNLIGASINLGGQGDNVVGINIDVGGATATSGSKVALAWGGGGLNGNYSKALAASAGFTSSNSIVSFLTTPTAITGTTHICTSMPMLMTVTEDFAAGALGISAASIGYVGQLGAAAGKTVDSVAMAVAGFSIDAGSAGGTITDSSMYLALGTLDFGGGPITLTNIYGFRTTSTFGALATNSWGVSIEDATAENFLKKSLVIGGSSKKVSNSDVALEIADKKAIMCASMTTTERNALTALAAMIIFNSSTNKFQGYNGSAWQDFN